MSWGRLSIGTQCAARTECHSARYERARPGGQVCPVVSQVGISSESTSTYRPGPPTASGVAGAVILADTGAGTSSSPFVRRLSLPNEAADDVPTLPLRFWDRLSVRLYPNQAAYASVSVRRSNSALGIITTSPLAPDIQEMLTGQSCCRTSASVSENVGSAF